MGQEAALEGAHHLGPRLLGPGVLDGHRRPAGQVLDEGEVGRPVAAVGPAHGEGQHADAPVAGRQGHRHRRPHAQPAQDVELVGVLGQLLPRRVGQLGEHAPARPSPRCPGAGVGRRPAPLRPLPQDGVGVGVDVGGDHQPQPGVVDEVARCTSRRCRGRPAGPPGPASPRSRATSSAPGWPRPGSPGGRPTRARRRRSGPGRGPARPAGRWRRGIGRRRRRTSSASAQPRAMAPTGSSPANTGTMAKAWLRAGTPFSSGYSASRSAIEPMRTMRRVRRASAAGRSDASGKVRNRSMAAAS